MNSSRPVFWYSGQFLDPQHFQQADCHHYHQLAASLSLNQPWPWGVDKLELDDAALSYGIVKIEKADFLFQDGSRTIIETHREDGNAVMEPRPLETIWPDRHKSLTLYAGLAKMAAKKNVAGCLISKASPQSDDLPSAHGRYLAAEVDEMLTDRYALPHPSLPDNSAPVRTLYYYVRLFTAEECRSRGDHNLFPLIRLKDQSLGPRLDPQWCPPLTRIAASPALLKTARAFETRLASLVGHLAPMRPANLYAAFSGQTTNLLSVAAITLSNLKMLLNRPNGQPWELFAVLRQGLAGMSSSLQLNDDTAAISGDLQFNHNSPLESLLPLEQCYTRILGAVMPEIVAETPFNIQDDLLVASLAPEAAFAHLEPLLMIKIDASVQELLAEGRLLAGSPDDVREALARAVPALPLKPVAAPVGQPAGPDIHYLKPDRSAPAWKRVLKDGRFAFIMLSGRSQTSSSLAAHSKLIFIKRGGIAPQQKT